MRRGAAVATAVAALGVGGEGASAATPGIFAGLPATIAEGAANPAAAPLPDGSALVVGGIDARFGLRAQALRFDPIGNGLGPAPSMSIGRGGPATAALADGRVLVAGGQIGGSSFTTSAELYDPIAQSWTATGSMTTPRGFALAAPLPDGSVLVVGGHDGTDQLATAETYNPLTGTWTAVAGTMATARQGPGVAPLPDGRVLVVGGNDGPPLASAELFDPATGTFSSAGTMTARRWDPQVAPLADGRVLITGGIDGAALASAEVYDPANGSFTRLPAALPRPRGSGAAVALADGRVLIAGGVAGGTIQFDAFAYLPPPAPQVSGGDLGEQTVGRASAAVPVAIVNRGAQSLRVTATALSGPDAADFATRWPAAGAHPAGAWSVRSDGRDDRRRRRQRPLPRPGRPELGPHGRSRGLRCSRPAGCAARRPACSPPGAERAGEVVPQLARVLLDGSDRPRPRRWSI